MRQEVGITCIQLLCLFRRQTDLLGLIGYAVQNCGGNAKTFLRREFENISQVKHFHG